MAKAIFMCRFPCLCILKPSSSLHVLLHMLQVGPFLFFPFFFLLYVFTLVISSWIGRGTKDDIKAGRCFFLLNGQWPGSQELGSQESQGLNGLGLKVLAN